MKRLRLEPTVILYAITAGWNAAQLVALPMRPWEHAAVLGITALLAALANRALVTPTAARQQPPAPPTGRQQAPEDTWAPRHALAPERDS